MARGWGRGMKGQLESRTLLHGDVEDRSLRTLCSDPVTKIPLRGLGSISVLGDILRDPGLILALRVSLYQDDL